MINKILHQVWVGDKAPPTHWMDTWKEHHPDWAYMLWDNKLVENYVFKNRKHIKRMQKFQRWHGVADIVRYEAVYDMGGVAVPADSICVKPIDDLLDTEMFTSYENEHHYPGRLTPIIGATKNHPFLKTVIDELSQKTVVNEPWVDTGNQFLTEMYDKHQPDIKVLPSYLFLPNHHLGGNWDGESPYYAEQFSATTFDLYK